MDGDQRFRRFLFWIGAATAAGALCVVAFVALIDPYRLYQLVDAPRFNRIKPALDRYQEEIKLTLARKAGANIILLGNSRVEIGMDPAILADAKRGDIPYNLAISGTGISTAREELEYLHAIGRTPKRVVLGMDFVDFLVEPSQKAPIPAQRKPSVQSRMDGPAWKFDTLFSLASLMDAWSTLQIQRQEYPETMARNGSNPLLEYNKYTQDEGYFAIFQQRAVEYAATFVRKPHGLRYIDTASSPSLDDLQAIIALAAQNKIELQMVIYPYHAQMLALFESSGLWPAFEQWKAILAEQAGAAVQRDSGAKISLWDFSGFSAIQCEPIPAINDRASVTRWYWESGHFKQSVGGLMLARLQETEAETSRSSAGGRFGVMLTSADLQDNRQRIARERASCAAATPQLFADASHLIQNARARLVN